MTDSYLTNIFLDVFEVSVPVSIIVAVLLLFGSFFNKRYATKVPGTIAGCTISSQSSQDTLSNKQRKEKLPEQMKGKSQSDYDKTEPSLLETGVSKGNEMEKSAELKKMLNVTKEGLTEQKEASLIVGDGFSFYLTDGEWQQAGEQEWRAVNNSKVHIWF